MLIQQIAKGFLNNLLNKEDELYKERIKICRQCKLKYNDKIFGESCNSTIYLNPITDEISKKPKEGFKNGCGCILRSKARV